MDRKVIAITGGAQGQGRLHAIKFAENGYDVALADMQEPTSERFQETVRELNELGAQVLAMKADVTSAEEMEAFFTAIWDKFGRLDVCIANAGIMNFGLTWELTDKQVQQMIDINLIGAWRTDKEAVKLMLKQGFGRIINISSTAGLKASPNLCHYAMAKFGLMGLTKSLAKEVAKKGITVNAVCPSMVKSPMTEAPAFLGHIKYTTGMEFHSFEEMDKGLSPKRPMGIAFIDPQDVSDMCFWVGDSHEARLISGQALGLDAGSLI